MAECDTNSSNSTGKNSNQLSDKADLDDRPLEMSGWLMKRAKISHKWKRQWFVLKDSELCYGKSEENTPKKIHLEAADIGESKIDHKSNGFRIKPKDGKRTFYLHADDESTQVSWMQAICFAKATGKQGDMSQACSVQ